MPIYLVTDVDTMLTNKYSKYYIVRLFEEIKKVQHTL